MPPALLVLSPVGVAVVPMEFSVAVIQSIFEGSPVSGPSFKSSLALALELSCPELAFVDDAVRLFQGALAVEEAVLEGAGVGVEF